MQKMHKGEEENCVSVVTQFFLIKLVIVLPFINNQHPETSQNFLHFPTFSFQIQNTKSDVFLTVKADNLCGHSNLPRLSSELFSWCYLPPQMLFNSTSTLHQQSRTEQGRYPPEFLLTCELGTSHTILYGLCGLCFLMQNFSLVECCLNS